MRSAGSARLRAGRTRCSSSCTAGLPARRRPPFRRGRRCAPGPRRSSSAAAPSPSSTGPARRCTSRRTPPSTGCSTSKGRRELELALQRWPPEVWEAAAGLAAEIGAIATFAAGLRLVPAGEALAERLALPDTSRLDWEIRQAARPRGAFHVEALVSASGVRARASVLRRALVPGPVWMRRQYIWARSGRGRLLAAYALHLLRAPLWAARAAWFRHRAVGADDGSAPGGPARPRV